MLKPLSLFAAVVLFAFTAQVTLGGSPQQTPAPKPSAADQQAKIKKLFELDCAMCHGTDGSGKSDLAKDMGLTMPDFSKASTLAGKSDKDLFDTIRNGKDKMPAEAEGRAKDSDVKDLIQYIRNFSKASASGN